MENTKKKNVTGCYWNNSEAWTEADCDVVCVGCMLRSCAKLVKMLHEKFLKQNS
jgi:hypothetical protein